MLSFEKCKNRLAVLWFTACGLLFVLLIFQTLAGKHGAASDEIWNWLLAAVLPTLSLMLGAFVADFGKGQDERQVKPFLFRLVFGLSAFYLLAVVLVVLAQPLTGKALLEQTKQTSVFLTAFQGLAAAALGVFFIKK